MQHFELKDKRELHTLVIETLEEVVNVFNVISRSEERAIAPFSEVEMMALAVNVVKIAAIKRNNVELENLGAQIEFYLDEKT